MNVIGIERAFKNHGDYTGTVKLTYDEVVMIRNALFQAQKNPQMRGGHRYKHLFNDWSDFADMVCYGRICSERVCESCSGSVRKPISTDEK